MERDPSAPPALEQLAEDLRPLTLVGGRWEYLAEEPAYDLAAAILRGDPPVQSTEGREARDLVGLGCPNQDPNLPCDDRVVQSNVTSVFNGPNIFSELGFRHDDRSRHSDHRRALLLRNEWQLLAHGGRPDLPALDGERELQRRRPPQCHPRLSTTDNCLPRIGFGMNASGPSLGWTGCYNVTVPSAWRSNSNGVDANRQHDYAVIDFHLVGVCANINPGDATGWRGTLIASTAQLTSNVNGLYGYPGVADPGGNRRTPSIWPFADTRPRCVPDSTSFRAPTISAIRPA